MTTSVQQYQDQIGSDFLVRLGDEAVALVLKEVGDTSDSVTERFALSFQGPADRFLEQNTYVLEHSELGEEAIFIVPVAKQAEGFIYQAVFYRIHQKEAE
jgi:hypothetical protein